MKPTFSFLVSPMDGNRYDNVMKVGDKKIILNTSIEDHKFTQRQAVLLGVPHWYSGEMEVGDTVIVHHNVFRRMYNSMGLEVSSMSHVFGDKYIVSADQLYMFKKPDGEWRAVDPFIFVTPVENDGSEFMNSNTLKPLSGIVECSSSDTFKKGDLVYFQPECEYEFFIDEKTMYRMFNRNITLIES